MADGTPPIRFPEEMPKPPPTESIHDELQRNKSFQDTFEEEKQKSSVFFACLAYVTKKFLKILADFQEPSSEEERDSLYKALEKFQKTLQILTIQDESQEMKYLLDLSEAWKKILKFLPSIEKESVKTKLNSLVEEISSYPKGQEFSLGYYLSESSASKWVPFPFMEILQALHEQNQKKPLQSLLKNWILQLNRLKEDVKT